MVETAVRIGVGEQCARASGLCIAIGGRVGRMRRERRGPIPSGGVTTRNDKKISEEDGSVVAIRCAAV